ncbi:LysE family translocator [Herbaspirillum sp. LeCh32-8]|uniref:LysE family translocator n=1 Tax=Herbaspirillum sp. LeCh32-8 TaxID=2821356 RepID=UPI001AEB0835|nr:LysE family translocator [Herbaspirillum sp. LeCh32-8]MBP0598312.1 LysE family translocator [Herbaspirillum sp. LeCh32-8]
MTPVILDWPAIAAVLSASAIGVAIPGANFVAIANKALAASRREAVCMSFGFALVNCLWAVLGILGASALVARYAWLGGALKLLGCAYLMWFGLRLILVAPVSAPAIAAATPMSRSIGRSAFRQGVALNIVNPKSLLYYCAFLSNVVPARVTGETATAMVFAVGACAVLWYSALGVLLSFPLVSARFRRSLVGINRACGVMLVALGLSELFGA